MPETRYAAPNVEPRRWWVLAVMSVGTLLVFLDDTVVNTALPRISVDLDASTSALQWVIDAYVLVLAGLLLLCGSIGDRYGRKRMMTIGLVVFGLAAAPGHDPVDEGVVAELVAFTIAREDGQRPGRRGYQQALELLIALRVRAREPVNRDGVEQHQPVEARLGHRLSHPRAAGVKLRDGEVVLRHGRGARAGDGRYSGGKVSIGPPSHFTCNLSSSPLSVLKKK